MVPSPHTRHDLHQTNIKLHAEYRLPLLYRLTQMSSQPDNSS